MACTATAEKMTLPAGTFDAMRIDLACGGHKSSIWLAPGTGIVKWEFGELKSIEPIASFESHAHAQLRSRGFGGR